MLNFAESGHPIFRATSALRSHFNGSDETVELILRTVISVNQLSIYGAVADLCKELYKDSEVAGKLVANEDVESMEIPTEIPFADPHTNAELQGNLLQDYEQKFEQLPEDQKLSKLCCDAGLKIVEKGQYFITLEEQPDEVKNSVSRVFTASKWRSIPSESVDSRKHENRLCLGCEISVFIKNFTVLKSCSNLCFETEQLHGFEMWAELTNM